MPARVHAILVARPDGRSTAALHLRRSLAALHAQSRAVDALTIVLCGADDALTDIARESGAEGVITTSSSTGYAAAVRLAGPRLRGDAVWLLAQDTAPEPDALLRLAGALELSSSLAFVAPKLVRWDDRSEIASLGVTMDRYGRAVDIAEGDLDQGQHDTAEDVLGSDVRGILVRRDAWTDLDGLDPALAGADEGLDLGVRARLAGRRVTRVPSARIAVAVDGVAGLPGPHRPMRRQFALRTAQLHRRLAYAPAIAVPFLWLVLLPVAAWRTVMHLVAKNPGRVVPEWAATLLVLVRLAAIARARTRIRRARTTGWNRIAPLRISQAELRLRWETDGVDPDAPVRSDLHFFTGGGAWAVLGALVVSVAAFPALLAWPVIGGEALAPMRATVARLWADTAYGQRALGLDTVGPADPFSFVVALIGSASPWEPGRAIVVLWILALPLAVLGAWFAATRLTERPLLRILTGVVWALAPTFLAALMEGRLAAVVLHLLLPWLFFTGSVAHRSWGAAGASGILLIGVAACAPVLVPGLVLIWLVAVLLAAIVARGRGITRLIWVLVPTAVFAAPLVWYRIHAGETWMLLADPGVAFLGDEVSADRIGRALLAAGFATADPGGWSAMTDGAPVWWVSLLAAPLAVLALLSLVTRRWITGGVLVVIGGVGLATAFAAVGIAVSVVAASSVAIWVGTGLSLAWLGVLGAAVTFLDAVPARVGVLRPIASVVVVVGLLVAAAPTLTATARGTLALTNGPESTLPAFVTAEGNGDARRGTIVLSPQGDGMVARVVWGGSETIGGQATIVSARAAASESDRLLAELAADLVTASDSDAVAQLADRGIAFVLLEAPVDDGEAELELRLAAETALDQREALDAVGETAKGALWRVSVEVTPRETASRAVVDTSRWIALSQAAVVVISFLLAIPTAASRRRARRMPRIVGPTAEEVR